MLYYSKFERYVIQFVFGVKIASNLLTPLSYFFLFFGMKFFHCIISSNLICFYRPSQEISEAYATLSVSNTRRKYDTGAVFRSYSVREEELTRHKFENEAFMKGRSDFKNKFGEPSTSSSSRQKLQVFTT